MHSSIPQLHASFRPNPKCFVHQIRCEDGRTIYSHLPIRIQTPSNCTLNITATISCSTEQENIRSKPSSPPYLKKAIFEQRYASSAHNKSINQTQKSERHNHKVAKGSDADTTIKAVIFSKMWWAEFKAAVGQRLNIEGIVSFVEVVAMKRQLAIPHVMVPDIRYIDWMELKRNGFLGVVFDKDNTITEPYSLSVWPPLESSVERCKSVFGNKIAVFSNSAGLYEYDPDGRKATALETTIGIKVIRHRVKKPGGSAEEIERHFGCQSSRLVMVGDRPFTDVVCGNRNGSFTILTEPLSIAEEPFIVKQVRNLEVALVTQWLSNGVKPPINKLVVDVHKCAKDSHTFEKF